MRKLVVLLVAIRLTLPCVAQSAAQPDLTEVLKRLDAVEHRVQELEQQNAQLRAQIGGPSAAPAAPLVAQAEAPPAANIATAGGA